MAGRKHQFILGLVIRQLRTYGCSIKYAEGKFIGDPIPKFPPKIINHRPDVVGITKDGQVCIGEAKTESDIYSQRTQTQLIDFVNLEINNMICEVFIVVPKNSKTSFENLLKKLQINDRPNLHVLYVPEEIINE